VSTERAKVAIIIRNPGLAKEFEKSLQEAGHTVVGFAHTRASAFSLIPRLFGETGAFDEIGSNVIILDADLKFHSDLKRWEYPGKDGRDIKKVIDIFSSKVPEVPEVLKIPEAPWIPEIHEIPEIPEVKILGRFNPYIKESKIPGVDKNISSIPYGETIGNTITEVIVKEVTRL